MNRSSRILLLVALACVAVAAVWLLVRERKYLPDDLLTAVPAQSLGIARIRTDEVLASDAWERLVVERGHAEGMLRVTEACGFNPLARIDDLVLFAMPVEGASIPDVAFVARGDLPHRELVDCVQKVTGADPDKFEVKEVEGFPVVAGSGESRAAFIGRDGIVGGNEDTVLQVLRVLNGKAKHARQDAELAGLWKRIDAEAPIAVAARLPERVRQTLDRLARLFNLQRFQGLLQIQTATGYMKLGKTLSGTLDLQMVDGQAAEQLVGMVDTQVEKILALPGVAATPVAPVLKAAEIEARGKEAHFGGTVSLAHAGTLLDLARAARRALDQPPDAAGTLGADGEPPTDTPAAEDGDEAQGDDLGEPAQDGEKPEGQPAEAP